jgi:hypothetical protein
MGTGGSFSGGEAGKEPEVTLRNKKYCLIRAKLQDRGDTDHLSQHFFWKEN